MGQMSLSASRGREDVMNGFCEGRIRSILPIGELSSSKEWPRLRLGIDDDEVLANSSRGCRFTGYRGRDMLTEALEFRG